MPQIPQFYAREALPASGGQGARGGIVGVPAITQPGAQDSGATALEKSLGALPEALEQAGGLAVQAEELQAHRQKAFDTLNATKQKQDTITDFQTGYEVWKQGDWQTLPERTLEEGNKLIAERKAQLTTPYAQQLFEADAKHTLNVYHQKALEERTKRTESATAFTLARELQQAQEDLARATNPYEVLVAQGRIETTAQRFVDANLVDGVKMATLVKGTYDAVDDEQNLNAIAVNPAGMRQQYQAQIRKQATDPNLPLARPGKLAEFAEKAWQTEQQRIAAGEHVEKMADYRLGKQQERAAADIGARLSIILPIPENVNKYDEMLAEVNAASQGKEPLLNLNMQQHFQREIRTLRAAATHPRDTDDAATERTLINRLDAANNDRDYQAVRAMVIQSAGLLKPETTQRFLNTIRERTVSGHYSQDAAYKEGTRIIIGADIAEGNLVAVMKGFTQEDEQRRLRDAMDNYRSWFEGMWQQDQALARAQSGEKALEMRRTYMDIPGKEAKLQALPLPLRGADGRTGVTDEGQADAIIDKLPGKDKAEKQRIKDQWKTWNQTYGEEAKKRQQSTTPQGTGGSGSGGTYQLRTMPN